MSFLEEQMLEVSIWNRNNVYGKCTIDLRSLPRERTQGLWQQLEETTAEVFLLVSLVSIDYGMIDLLF